MTPDSDRIWQYWTGPRPPYIDVCLESVSRHNPFRVCLLDDRSFERLWTDDRDVDLSGLRPQQRANFVRAYLLQKFGGCWIDADFLCFRPVAPLWSDPRGRTFLAYRAVFNGEGVSDGGEGTPGYGVGWDNDFIWAAPGSPFAAEFYRRVLEVMRRRPPGSSLKWAENGGLVLTPLVDERPDEVIQIPTDYVSPYRVLAASWALEEFAEMDTWRPAPTEYGIQLVNSVMDDRARELTRAELLASPTVLGHWVRAALRSPSDRA